MSARALISDNSHSVSFNWMRSPANSKIFAITSRSSSSETRHQHQWRRSANKRCCSCSRYESDVHFGSLEHVKLIWCLFRLIGIRQIINGACPTNCPPACPPVAGWHYSHSPRLSNESSGINDEPKMTLFRLMSYAVQSRKRAISKLPATQNMFTISQHES